MIRNMVLGRLRNVPDDAARAADVQQLDRALHGIAALQLPGQLSMSAGRDAGLRAGGWSFGIVNDWIDVEAYRAYDLDAEHNRHRAAVGEVCAEIARVQVELPGAG